jgi:hypothetical protein
MASVPWLLLPLVAVEAGTRLHGAGSASHPPLNRVLPLGAARRALCGLWREVLLLRRVGCEGEVCSPSAALDPHGEGG